MAGAREQVGRFQVGGALGEGAFYVERDADRELLAALRSSELCYVFATTQTGKSSLKLRAQEVLEAEGVAVIDITLAGGVTEEQWYYGLARSIAREARLDLDVAAFWAQDEKLSQVQRWAAFLREELLPRVEGKMVIFLDEVNVVGGLGFETESFFASIRDVYDARARDRRYHALTFCLLGITFPEALMKDHARSPFRGARAIAVDDFTRAETDALAPGLTGAGADTKALLDEVFAWTHGHPYMTQRLCAVLAEGGDGSAEDRVRRAVEEAFLDASKPRDPNLRFAEKYLERQDVPAAELVFLYRRVLEGQAIAFEPNSAVEQHACLSGLVAARLKDDGKRWLEVRNKVFDEVLGLAWVRQRENDQRLDERVRQWLQAVSGEKMQHLLRGKELDEALVRVQQRTPTLQEEAFLRASQTYARDKNIRAHERMLSEADRGLAQVSSQLERLTVSMRRDRHVARISGGLALVGAALTVVLVQDSNLRELAGMLILLFALTWFAALVEGRRAKEKLAEGEKLRDGLLELRAKILAMPLPDDE